MAIRDIGDQKFSFNVFATRIKWNQIDGIHINNLESFTMKWQKRGLIYKPMDILWMKKYGMMPCPLHLPDLGVIRIFMGVADNDNFGVTTYIDVSDSDPSKVISIENTNPIVGLGAPGTFDDCGAIPSCCLKVEGAYHLYYVGFQRAFRVPYMLFPGLAISADARNFERFSQAPILNRSKDNFYSCAAPCVLFDEGVFKMWLWIGRDWIKILNKFYLSASIGYAESTDGLHWKIVKQNCIVPVEPLEFSVGRPWVIRDSGLFKMFYSIRYAKEMYRLGYAESRDGIHWIRKDSEMEIGVSDSGWDSQMICYSSVMKLGSRTYMFYNGNNNGETGFGWAELVDEK